MCLCDWQTNAEKRFFKTLNLIILANDIINASFWQHKLEHHHAGHQHLPGVCAKAAAVHAAEPAPVQNTKFTDNPTVVELINNQPVS